MTTPPRISSSPVRRANDTEFSPTDQPLSSQPATVARGIGPAIVDEPAGLHLPAYLRARPADGRTVPLACANVSVASAADLQRNAREVRDEIEHMDDGALSLMAAQLDGLRAQSTSCSADAVVTISLPSHGPKQVQSSMLRGLRDAIDHQAGFLQIQRVIVRANQQQLDGIAAGLQRGLQSRGAASGTGVRVVVAGDSHTLSQSDAIVVGRMLDARARFLRVQSDNVELLNDRFRTEIWRGGAMMTPVVGSVLGAAECIRGRTITGERVTRTECAMVAVGAALELVAAGIHGARLASTIARTEELTLATTNAGVRLTDVVRAVSRMSPADRQLVRELVDEMRAAARAEVEGTNTGRVILSAAREEQARSLLTRAGIREGTQGAVSVGNDVHRAGNNLRAIREQFPEALPVTSEQTTDWSLQYGGKNQAPGVGSTTEWGAIQVSPLGQHVDRMRAVFHERVHQLFRVRVAEQPRVLQGVAECFNRHINALHAPQLLRYVDEFLAEATALARTADPDWLRHAVVFPLNPEYGLSITRVGAEAIATGALLGYVVVEGQRYRAEIVRRNQQQTPIEMEAQRLRAARALMDAAAQRTQTGDRS